VIFEDTGLENWIDVATSHRMLAATRTWKRQGIDSSLEPPECGFANILILA
jgi:hypothetical protein